MSAIHDLIGQISDPRLRERLTAEWKAASQGKKFGLVFEQHLPELLPLYKAKPRRGDLVCRRQGALTDVWQVKSIRDGVVTCVKPKDETHPSEPTRAASETVNFAVDEVLVVREFGEPIFPSLVPVDVVANGPAEGPWHTLIEADNYHALQLLDYLYAGKVDCIYIDPPYNSGASDWKYNNDYVDKNDQWRHSKWLAFMERRLRIAQRLLTPSSSILIIAIDDNELFSLGLLLDDLFPGMARQIVNVTINPKGKARDGRLSQVDEYLLLVYIGAAIASSMDQRCGETELRWPYLRRSDVESARGTTKGGIRQFYPIYVELASARIARIGDPLAPDEPLSAAPEISGCIAVFPIREDGKHMNWGLTGQSLESALRKGFVRVTSSSNPYQPFNFQYVTVPSIKKIEDGKYRIAGVRPDGSRIVTIPDGREIRATTAWKKNTHDANAYGSQLIGAILPEQKFPFPKSIYSVLDALKLFVSGNRNALIVDFFAGSGTTLNAVNLLNAADGGSRRCILVTNNEVSAKEAEVLRGRGLQTCDEEWEALGICRSVTWPRSKQTILGRRDDGTPLPGDYLTGRTVEKERARTFTHIGFVDPATFLVDTPATAKRIKEVVKLKKQVVAMIDGLPQTLVTEFGPFIVSEEHKASILFDPAATDDWLEALDGQEHITDFYIVTPTKRVFDGLKAQVNDLLGPISVQEDEKRPMSEGFPANLAYFKLDFLDKDRVTLKRAFREILPLLWLKAGAVGPRPELARGEPEPAVFAPAGSNFVVLLEESRLAQLLRILAERCPSPPAPLPPTGEGGISHVFIVTDSDESFKAMAAEVREAVRQAHPGVEVLQLYRDYLANFMINTGAAK